MIERQYNTNKFKVNKGLNDVRPFKLITGSHTRRPSGTGSIVIEIGAVITYESTAANGSVWFTDQEGLRGKVESGNLKNLVEKEILIPVETHDKWLALSPDNFPIYPDENYDSEDEAYEALKDWVQRYKSQGYYRSTKYGCIAYGNILSKCNITPASKLSSFHQPA